MLKGVAPLRRETLQSQVHQRLSSLILEGELAPGESITVASIAEALGISPMPVREAISRLTALGALTVVSGRSIGVPKLTLDELADLRRVRLQVEATAVKWATENVDDKFIGSLRSLLDAMEEAEELGRVKDFIHANYDFHFTIYRQAQSPVLLEIISNIWLRVNPHFHLLHRYGHYRVSNRQHRALLEAICARDVEAAVCSLHEDINSAYEVIRGSLTKQKEAG